MSSDGSSKSQHRLRRWKEWNYRKHFVIGASLVLTSVASLFQPRNSTLQFASITGFSNTKLDALNVIPEQVKWGISLDKYKVIEDILRPGDILGEILMQNGLSYPEVASLVEKAKGIFNITSMRIGKKYYFLSTDLKEKPEFMVYEPSAFEYVIFHMAPPFKVEVVKRDVEKKYVSASGVLETNFWQALTDNGLDDEVADGMIDVLAHSVDFYHQKQGDRFKVLYEQYLVEGHPVGSGKIIAALYEREGKEYYAFNFEKQGESAKYFDFEGRPAKKAFLKAPVKFSRISSRFSQNRLHPILGYNRPHFGTDYAAPYGTPILAIADGTVSEATRKGGNGNYVKIRHDKTYESQYLHMSGFAKGIHPGSHVEQGQTIGYVGSTGLATGPHVCFRFWKNGAQVDHLKLNLPTPQPIAGADLAKYTVIRDSLKTMLDGVQYRTRSEIFQARSEEEKTHKVKP